MVLMASGDRLLSLRVLMLLFFSTTGFAAFFGIFHCQIFACFSKISIDWSASMKKVTLFPRFDHGSSKNMFTEISSVNSYLSVSFTTALTIMCGSIVTKILKFDSNLTKISTLDSVEGLYFFRDYRNDSTIDRNMRVFYYDIFFAVLLSFKLMKKC